MKKRAREEGGASNLSLRLPKSRPVQPFVGHTMTERLAHIETQRTVSDVYDTSRHETLGMGLNGAVVKVKHRLTGVTYAMKTMRLPSTFEISAAKQLQEELEIMAQFDHPNILRLQEAFYTSHHVHMILELCDGGDLFEHLEAHDYGYDETLARKTIRTIFEAVDYLHKHGVVHRDLKLENILFDGTGTSGLLKVADFGLAQHFKHGHHLRGSAVGTPYYMSPEASDPSQPFTCGDEWMNGAGNAGAIDYERCSHTYDTVAGAGRHLRPKV